VGHHWLRCAQDKCKRYEPLLRPVVQIALDAATGLVGGGDDTGARGGELGSALGVRDRGGEQFSPQSGLLRDQLASPRLRAQQQGDRYDPAADEAARANASR
jgi:hypothetical protein